MTGLAVLLTVLAVGSAARGAVEIPVGECLRILAKHAGFPGAMVNAQ